jgi:hypothetical protein
MNIILVEYLHSIEYFYYPLYFSAQTSLILRILRAFNSFTTAKERKLNKTQNFLEIIALASTE